MLSRVLGILGKTFILAGLFILGFVAFQLWGTGIEESRSQSELTDRLATSVRDEVPTAKSDDDDASELAAALAKVDPATAPATAEPADGQPIGIIQIPKIDLERVIVQGVNKADLKKGPGHYPGTPLPGQAGNSGIAGHRTTYGAPFNRIDELVPGDDVVISTAQGQFHYTVIAAPGSDQAAQIVKPSDVSVLADKGDDRITMTACHPKYSARQRIVVSAVLSNPPVAAPAAPVTASVATPAAALDEGMGGDPDALLPAIGLVLGAIALGIGAWFIGRHRRKVPTWLVATPLILVLVWFSWVYLDRFLPSL